MRAILTVLVYSNSSPTLFPNFVYPRLGVGVKNCVVFAWLESPFLPFCCTSALNLSIYAGGSSMTIAVAVATARHNDPFDGIDFQQIWAKASLIVSNDAI